MNALTYVALIGWMPAVLLIFATMPRRAPVVAFVAGWLFLPVASLSITGLPDYTKASATALAVLLGMLLFDRGRLVGLRFRWFDMPMIVWCLTPFASSLSNGLGVYDGLSSVLNQSVIWGLPYFLGRAYFSELDGLRELAIGVAVGGLIYIPLCLYEVRMSPQLHTMVYGYYPHSGGFSQVKRFGGYRPVVFMIHGLAVGMWMCGAALVGYWLWASGSIRRMAGVPFGALLVGLLVTVVLCKSSGALVLLAVGIVILEVVRKTASKLLIWALVLVAPVYIGARTTNLWTGDSAVELADKLGSDRASSLSFRFRNEDILVAKARSQPVFGWGGWGRNRVYDEEGKDLSVTDGLWVIALGKFGLVGLTSITAATLLPLILLAARSQASAWRSARQAPAVALAMLLCLYMIDNLMNDMVNPVYTLAIGGATAYAGRRRPEAESPDPGPWGSDLDQGRGESLGDPAGIEANRNQAACCSVDPGAAILENEDSSHVLDGQNNLVWAIVNDPDAMPRDMMRVVRIAEEFTAIAPEHGAYWNTLGAVYYRAGDWDAAITALERSIELTSGGTGYDYYYLAMAYQRRQETNQARAWLGRGDDWTAQHGVGESDLLRIRAEACGVLGISPASLNHPKG